MRPAAVGAVLALALAHAAAAQVPVIPDRQIVTADDIRQAAVQRLSDLFRLIDGWTVVMRDGWHADATAGGLDLEETGGWELWIDGHRAGTRLFGQSDINLLPLTPEDIDHVEAFRTPSLIGGVFASRGLLHIHTRAAAEEAGGGFSIRGSTWIGNETGDPGPLRFLGDDARNVDHLGPDHAASADYSSPALHVHAGGVRRKHYPTDAAIVDRHFAFASSYPTIELYGGALQIHAAGLGEHDVTLHGSQLDDFFFLKPFGREIPARTARIFAGARGIVRSTRETRLLYRFSFTRSELDRRPNPKDLTFDWAMDRLDGSVEWARRGGNFEAGVGVSAEHRSARGQWNWTDPSLLHAGFHIRLRRAGDGLIRPTAILHTFTDGGVLRLLGMMALEGRVGRRHAYHAALAFARGHAADEMSLRFWTRRGYGLLDTLGIDYSDDALLEDSRDVTLDVRWRTAWGDSWSSTIGVFVRYFSNHLLEIPQFHFDPVEAAFSGPVRLSGPHDGSLIGAEAVVEVRLSDDVRQRAYVRLRPLQSGNGPLRDMLARQPDLEARSIWFISPSPTFAISPRMVLRSATRWNEYAGAEIASDGRYRATVPWRWTVDVAISKSLWKRRLHVALDLRNLLNRPHRDHPVGASYDLSLSFRLGVNLGR